MDNLPHRHNSTGTTRYVFHVASAQPSRCTVKEMDGDPDTHRDRHHSSTATMALRLHSRVLHKVNLHHATQ